MRVETFSPLRFPVGDLLHRVGARREISAEAEVEVDLEGARVHGPVTVTGVLEAMVDGIVATIDLAIPAHLTCNRCLGEWDTPLNARFVHVFADRLDDEASPIQPDDSVDLSDVVHDEVALALPMAPLCRSDCAGLCPACGTDLNSDPCLGHDDESPADPASPFSALGQLLDH
ncbi:MAG TPA: DUF177 domain-containing protein [Acidimicrobiia bacterium]|nr:DUF177 domain-containing protein [Acidimicrobiia bacterium]